MITALTLSQLYVLNQDEALDFYVGKLGMEVRKDFDLGFMRWLTIGVPGQPETEVLLELPERPYLDDAANEQIRSMVTKGAGGGWLGFATDDAQKLHDELVAQGVEVVDPPTQRFYGTDFGIRDPFGNPIRIVQSAGEYGAPPSMNSDESDALRKSFN
ncbi:MAG: VOC family protein [Dehalococcoidia bacterium]|nr:VOC family protein [Dehalococcoidia bacterium]MCA9856319.1 VOC family protein [Dehalococcoidia bacterium]